ncbi:MAG: riboflavin synthase [Micrococcales bacterium]|nr:riboflavin synthase [Micrococcales bacterium]
MFTGIVEEMGRVVDLDVEGRSARITVGARAVLEDAKLGDSVAVAGVCLTVTQLGEGSFSADVMPETMARTGLGALRVGDPVNLERAVRADGRLGGHVVSGHVDGQGVVAVIEPGVAWLTMAIDLPEELARFVAPQGSIAVDGVSLTVVGIEGVRFTVGLIPTTLEVTTLGGLRVGDRVNLETDILAKYVARLVAGVPA